MNSVDMGGNVAYDAIMTRKDYKLIASAITEARAVLNARTWPPPTASDAVHAIVRELSLAFTRSNPRFDCNRFWNEIYK